MPNFASQLSKAQLKHVARKSVSRASKRYGALFMQSALDATDHLSDAELQRLVEMPDFGEAVARWHAASLFFSGEVYRGG
jgi:hypothetical protein